MSAELWALLGVIVMQLAGMYNNYRTHKANAPLIDAQADAAMSEGWVKLAQEYARQIESLKKLEVENSELRPLVLKLALNEKVLEQAEKDKADWKKYSNTIVKQLETCGQIPIPFRRYPSNGDSHKMQAITPEQTESAKKSG